MTKKEVIDNLKLTVSYKKKISKITGTYKETDFFLVGILPVIVIFENGKEGKTLLMEKINVSFFPELKQLFGKQVAMRGFNRRLKNKWGNDLLTKMMAGIKKIEKNKVLGKKKIKEMKIWRENTSQH